MPALVSGSGEIAGALSIVPADEVCESGIVIGIVSAGTACDSEIVTVATGGADSVGPKELKPYTTIARSTATPSDIESASCVIGN